MIIRKIEPQKQKEKPALRVAGYARVSDGKDAMLRSLSAQISYFSDYIQQHEGWAYAGVYADEAVTGTKDTRAGLQELLAECRAGKVDLIITKSITRFARNTVILLETARDLRALGIGIYFEKENINTLSKEGELMLTILASFAQEESRSVSENCKWRIRKKFEDGKPVGLRWLFGYDINKGVITIDEKNAGVVRRIYSLYLDGYGVTAIAKILRAEHIPSEFGGKWSPQRISSILRNEKYTGNSLLQKKYTSDHLTKKQMRNKGEQPQYFVENTHTAIISTAMFDAVQTKLQAGRNKFSANGSYTNRYILNGIVFCGLCGKTYRRRLIHGKPWWICGTKVKFGKCACGSGRIPEDTLIAAVTEVLGLPSFDESVFVEEIASIYAAENNTLRFIFKDGRESSAAWRLKSRRESWTAEMREIAREQAKKENIRKESEKCQRQQ